MASSDGDYVAGTEGYTRFSSRFISLSQGLDFHEICKDFVDYLPPLPARILDAGSGAGQNAASLDTMGFEVTAVEPIAEFREAAQIAYKDSSVQWVDDSLPELRCLSANREAFDFVLVEGVWHHLDEVQREQAVHRFSELVSVQGRCALSLRNGPAGLGTRVHPTQSRTTIEQFDKCGFDCVLHLENLSSILPNKEDVKWSRLVFQKR